MYMYMYMYMRRGISCMLLLVVISRFRQNSEKSMQVLYIFV